MLLYILVFISFSGLYLFLFHIPLFTFQHVLFYRGLLLLTATAVISFTSAFFLAHKNKAFSVYLESIISAVIVSISINFAIFVLLPVTFDRSVSTYLLSTLNTRATPSCRGLTKKQLEGVLIDQYIVKNKALQKRIIEQEEIGFISDNGECITLTDRARTFLRLKQITEELYNLR